MHRDQLPIPEPCHADWTAMTGDDRRRFCASCTKHVHDLSAMTEPQARAVLRAEAEPCVRYTVEPTGKIRFAPRRRDLVRAMAAGALLGGILGSPAATASSAPADHDSALGQLVERVRTWLLGPEGCAAPTEAEQPVADTGSPPDAEPPRRMGKPKPPTKMGKIAMPEPEIVQGGVMPVPPPAPPEPPAR